MKKRLAVIALLVAILMVVSLFTGCTKQESTATKAPDASKTNAPANTSTSKNDSNEEDEDPADWTRLPVVDDPITLTAWWPTPNEYISDMNDMLSFKEGTRITNIHWEFTTPSKGSEKEQFNLLLASQEYPDLIKGFTSYYTKGIDFGIEDGVIIGLEDYLYAMPDIDRWRSSTELIKKSLTTDGGHFGGIPMILIGSEDHLAQGAYSGYGIRTDWMNNLGMSVPETYDELASFAAAVQDAGYCESPIEIWPNANTYAIMGGYNIVDTQPGYGVAGGWMIKDNKVVYALYEDNYKSYIGMLADWYSKGYIDPDYYTSKDGWNYALTHVSNNELGVFNFMYTWYEMFKNTALDSSFDIAALPVLRINKTDTVHVKSAGSGASIAASVTAQCEHPEYVCAYWNYFFTDDGIILGNYGVEGETFDYVDGKPTWNEGYYKFVDEHDSSYAQNMCFIFLGPGFRWWDRETQGVNETALSFLKVWDSNDIVDSEYFYPSAASMTGDESTEYANIMGDVGTYISENLTQFITCAKSMSEWDAFVDGIRGMGIEKALAFKQAAYDRYLAR